MSSKQLFDVMTEAANYRIALRRLREKLRFAHDGAHVIECHELIDTVLEAFPDSAHYDDPVDLLEPPKEQK